MNGLERRRSFLKYAAVLGLPVFNGCCLFEPREIIPYCPNSGAVSDRGTELTIDVHAHVFNGSDLPVKKFLELVMSRQVGVPGSVAGIIGELLQTAAWSRAPKAREELAELENIKLKLATCSDRNGQLAISAMVQAMADRAFRNGVQELTNAFNSSPALRSARQKGQDPAFTLDMKIQAESAVADEIELVSKIPTYGEYRKYLAARRLARAW